MHDDQPFLDAIRAAPDDDTPRLIYADWLEDHGDVDRAEFIRVQCEAARTEDRTRKSILGERAAELLAPNKEDWLGILATTVTTWRKNRYPSFEELISSLTFSRGFAEYAKLTPAELLEYGADLVREQPAICISLNELGEDLLTLLDSPELGLVHGLSFGHGGNPLNSETFSRLVSSPNLTGLRSISLYDCPIGVEGIRALAAAEHVKSLEDIQLTRCEVGANGVEVLARCVRFSTLRKLAFAHETLGNAGFETIASSRCLTGLRSFAAQDCQVSESGVRALVSAPRLTELTDLDLRNNSLGNAGAEWIATSPNMTNLRELNLSYCNVRNSGFAAIAASTGLPRLKELFAEGNRFNARTLRLLAVSPVWAGLLRCDITNCEIGEEGAKALASSAHEVCMENLCLDGNGIGPFGVKALLTSPGLRNLRWLGLNGNRVGDLGVQILANSPRVASLYDLTLRNNHIRDEGVKALLESQHFVSLQFLDLTHNDISAAGIAALRSSDLGRRLGHISLDEVTPE